ncbi:MAG: sulfotransferase [Phycisphaerales bacterium]|nr:sulfotransferase [Phycisphaerales bacterium]
MDNQSHTSLVVRPDFIIIGAMKCATSSLHDQLALLDGISMSEPKEPNFFSDPDQWAMGMPWYESLFASMPSGDLKGESSTHYTKLPTYPKAARRLNEFVPDAKLIYVMRDPVDRIVSQYIHEWSMHVIDKDCPIDEAIKKYPILLDYSRYAMQLEPYFELFGQGTVLPVFFERLMGDPQSELERVAQHIGYSGVAQWVEDEAKNVSSQRQRRNPILNAILDIRAVQIARRSLLPESMRQRVRSRWTMSERPQLSNESIHFIGEELNPDLAKLGDLLDRELTCASFKDQVTSGVSPSWKEACNV